jgi:hypothetical protein
MHGFFAIRRSSTAALVGLAGLAFVVGPSVIHGRIPADIGDSRLTSYILEHFFRWITGQDVRFGRVPGDGLGVVGKWPAGATVEGLA